MGDTWEPITKAKLGKIIERDLKLCDTRQLAVWKKYSVIPKKAPIDRNNQTGYVFIVAIKNNEAMYYEDVEEGFNLSPLGEDGKILEHWCNQDELPFALNNWIN